MKISWLAVTLICLSPATVLAAADNLSAPLVALNQFGQVGFIRLPSARRLEPGTAYAGFASGDPYYNTYAGFQPLPALRITLRQTYDTNTTYTYPGFDAQVQLWRETAWRPAAAIGYTHMYGQNRFAGEYLVFNKRYWDIDFMAGLGWGRYASSDSTLRNPFRIFSAHFDSPARDNGTGKYGPNAWFKGDNIGIFAGLDYQTPFKPLSLQLEYDPDRYVQERIDDGIKPSLPFNLGARYVFPDNTFLSGFAVQAALESTDRFMLHFNYALNYNKAAQGTLQATKLKELESLPLSLQQNDTLSPPATLDLARYDKLDAYGVHKTADDLAMWVRVPDSDQPPAAVMGQAAYTLAAHNDDTHNTITVTPEYAGLTAGSYRFLADDLYKADHHVGSREEIWQDAQILPALAMPDDATEKSPLRMLSLQADTVNQMSFYDFGQNITARQKQLFGARLEPERGFILAGAGFVESDENLDDILPSRRPVRSLVNQYAQHFIGMERLYGAWLGNLSPEISTRVSAGYFEEMFGGVSGEILYQPLAARWALGLDVNYLAQRDPDNAWGFLDYRTTTGALSFYYEMPKYNLTTIIRLEEFLARDYGVELAMQHHFIDGTRLSLQTTYSDRKDLSGPADYDHLDISLYLQVPLYANHDDAVPVDVTLVNNLKSFGRDTGQTATIPDRLFDVSRPVSYGAVTHSWDHFLDSMTD